MGERGELDWGQELVQHTQEVQEAQEDWEDANRRQEMACDLEEEDVAVQEVQEAQREVLEVQDHCRRHPPDRAALADRGHPPAGLLRRQERRHRREGLQTR